MTPEQKEEIYKLRLQGLGYKAIAREMQLTVDAIKGYCRRHHLNGPAEVVELNSEVIKEKNALCLHCKNPIRQKQYGRRKRFCSDACRYTWWNENQDKRSKKPAAIYQYTCQNCGRKFSAYGNKQRKYCSHNCFVKFKFWSEEDGI
ncbi:helix-turn-helix domain-containing protein [Sporomusa ovata]|uniref:Zinc-finger protein n=1 Tax=Sporomusa ovata TaxID=2378 RepID=A0A0U1L5Y1_9FIRM|nr:helix-turn-helix domain-containing protein [Sporomusa ovata]CQR75080.1 Zinc-finger protein [Sporomusa ovata]